MLTEPQYPNAPSPGKTDTSAAAAEDVARGHRSMQIAIGDLVRANPDGLSSEQVAERLGFSVYSVRARMAELRAMAHVRDSGLRIRNGENRKVIVWRWVAPGAERGELLNAMRPVANDAEPGGCCSACGRSFA